MTCYWARLVRGAVSGGAPTRFPPQRAGNKKAPFLSQILCLAPFAQPKKPSPPASSPETIPSDAWRLQPAAPRRRHSGGSRGRAWARRFRTSRRPISVLRSVCQGRCGYIPPPSPSLSLCASAGRVRVRVDAVQGIFEWLFGSGARPCHAVVGGLVEDEKARVDRLEEL
jgi:hypothetical protein